MGFDRKWGFEDKLRLSVYVCASAQSYLEAITIKGESDMQGQP